MNPVVPPTTVGDLRWPVLSAVRMNTADEPVEFVVVVASGEPTSREPYATLRLFVWSDHSKAEQRECEVTHNIDLGADDITPAWVAAQLVSARRLSPAAAAHAGEVIAMYGDADVDVA